MPTFNTATAGGGMICLMIVVFAAYVAIIIYVLILMTRFVKAHESIATSARRIADRNGEGDSRAFPHGPGSVRLEEPPR